MAAHMQSKAMTERAGTTSLNVINASIGLDYAAAGTSILNAKKPGPQYRKIFRRPGCLRETQ